MSLINALYIKTPIPGSSYWTQQRCDRFNCLRPALRQVLTIYGPDLDKTSHTPKELAALGDLEPNLYRLRQIRRLAEAKRKKALRKTLDRDEKRVLGRYEAGGLRS